MTAVITEGGAAAGRTSQAPAIPDLTLPGFVLGAAYRHGGKRALVDAATGRELSYAVLADAVREVAAGLSARGIRPGDLLALCTPNCLESAVTWFAATSAGAIVTTVNPLGTEDEISRQLSQTGAQWLVATAELIEQKLNAVLAGTAIHETFAIGEGIAGTTPFGSLRVTADAPAALACASDISLPPTSSGTTGLPKSVELTHRNLVASLRQTSLAHQVTEDDVVIAALPLFHIYGLQITLNLPLAAGATVVILPRFELAAFLRVRADRGRGPAPARWAGRRGKRREPRCRQTAQHPAVPGRGGRRADRAVFSGPRRRGQRDQTGGRHGGGPRGHHR